MVPMVSDDSANKPIAESDRACKTSMNVNPSEPDARITVAASLNHNAPAGVDRERLHPSAAVLHDDGAVRQRRAIGQESHDIVAEQDHAGVLQRHAARGD